MLLKSTLSYWKSDFINLGTTKNA